MQIYELIGKVISECPAIGKNQRNQQQGFMYRGVDAVMNVFQPLFAKHGIFVVPEVLESHREERQTSRGGNLIYTVLRMKYTFYAPDGSNVCAIVQGEGMDSADKSSNKAMSAAFKYALFQVFCIPTEEMADPDAETPDNSRPKEYVCADCGAKFQPFEYNGKQYTAHDAYYNAAKLSSDGVSRCKSCRERHKEEK